jgi:hypothetical protein
LHARQIFTLRARDLRCVQRISLFTLTTTYMPVARATLDNWAPQYDPSVRARRAPPQLRACVPQPLLLATFDTYLVAHEYLCLRICAGQCDTALPLCVSRVACVAAYDAADPCAEWVRLR